MQFVRQADVLVFAQLLNHSAHFSRKHIQILPDTAFEQLFVIQTFQQSACFLISGYFRYGRSDILNRDFFHNYNY